MKWLRMVYGGHWHWLAIHVVWAALLVVWYYSLARQSGWF
jgi:hypothetical protein